MNSTASYLKHQFLIAMPHMADPNFAQTVIYLIEHNAQGAMGLVVNRAGELSLADVLEQLRPDSPGSAACQDIPIHVGGPVQTDRGFVLHPSGQDFQATLALGEVALSTSQDVLFAIADQQGPSDHFICLGYAGWSAGQLEAELSRNGWLTVDADPAVIFDTPAEQRYERALQLLGIDPRMLSQEAGHA